ncbi:hypothetical protein FOCC_FOCC000583 [Frankliniella occidentalis]|uniref:Uncharacterized protein F54H12.2-like n=1 Tax=Frankliniella occidentalis TaxID=133901 RepID=A0A6J1T0A0_FRAOC|nr:uncharacterized protein F54H12.2-like [Frankliniella occidentalis]KAE8752845.1 hypothetical protein FOCC_FOCC000583 [Frankliniella occidentalis]
MSLLHQNSCECIKSELDFFSVPPSQQMILGTQDVEFYPVSPIIAGTVIDVVVPPCAGEYLYDVNGARLNGVGRLTGATAAAADALPAEAPVNLIPHSCFSHVELILNGKQTSCGSHMYPYKSYIETHLGYGSDAKASHLTNRLYYADTAWNFNKRTADNEGYEKRAKLFKGGRSIDIVTPISLPFLNQQRMLLSGVEMRFRFHFSKPEFHIMGPENSSAQFEWTSFSLTIPRAQISPSVLLAQSRALETATAKYPICRTECKTLTINAGLRSKVFDSVYLGQLPKRVILGMVDNTAFNGAYTENPFNFDHMDLSFAALYINGVQVPARGLNPDFTHARSTKYADCYQTLFSGSGVHHKDEGNGIDREAYPGGNCFLIFDLSPDRSSHEGHWNLQQTGCLRIELRFKRDLVKAVNLVVYAEFQSLIEIDKYRTVHTDYST